MDELKGKQRKSAGQHSALEVRLNRALEECDKYKTALHSATTHSKVGGCVCVCVCVCVHCTYRNDKAVNKLVVLYGVVTRL